MGQGAGLKDSAQKTNQKTGQILSFWLLKIECPGEEQDMHNVYTEHGSLVTWEGKFSSHVT